MVLAGPRNCGKSLLIDILVKVFGGRRGHPYKYMTGRTTFNGELLGCELLTVDDEAGSTDIKTRRALAASYKGMLFSGAAQIEPKFEMPISCDPCWRLVIACNDEPESLLVLPTISEDMLDKITMIACFKRVLPMRTGTTEERTHFFDALVSEIPCMLADLQEMEIPADLKEDRCGVVHFHNPVLLASLDAMAPEIEMLEIIDRAFPVVLQHPGFIFPWEGTAAELRQLLLEFKQAQRDVERILFNSAVVGKYLARLEKTKRVERLKLLNGYQNWKIYPKVSVSDMIRENKEAKAAAKNAHAVDDDDDDDDD